MADTVELTHEQLQQVYEWIDQIPLSRPKRNIARDFADGVLMSEVVKYFFPKAVDLHNYTKSSSQQQKTSNWQTLNQKVFRRMNFVIHDDDIADIINHKRGAIERVLLFVQHQFAALENVEGHAVVRDGEDDRTGSARISSQVAHSSAVPSTTTPATPHVDVPMTGAPVGIGASLGGYGATNVQPQAPASAPNGEVLFPSISPAKQRPQGKSRPSASVLNKEPKAPVPAVTHMASNVGGSGAVLGAEAAFVALQSVMSEKDAMIADLRETIEILQNKVNTLEKLVKLKDAKIHALAQKLDRR